MEDQPAPGEFVSVDPATGRPFARTPALSDAQLEQVLARAHADFLRWRDVPLAKRAALLVEIARQLELDAQNHAALMSREMGKPFREALAEVKKCAWTARHFAEHGPAQLGDEATPSDATRSFVRYEPLGPILAIMPWNFPFWQVFRFAIPALLAGNVVVLKHAAGTMGCAAGIEGVFRKAGAPRGLLQSAPIDHAAVARAIADPRVAAVTLTGSTGAGRAIAAIAGRHLKPSVLELGGSDPFIVMPSEDLELATRTAVLARVQNGGQSCIAAKRFIVHEAVHGQFEAELVGAMRALRAGDPMDETVDLGPLASDEARRHLQQQVDESIAQGARCLLGGRIPSGPGWFYPPTVLSDAPAASPAGQDELFGPVASIVRARDLEHAIELANATAFGLGASVWTREEAEIERALAQLRAGAVFVNGMVRSDPRLPFGGRGDSGWGRELGWHGLFAFTNIKTVWIR
ncbi:MAG: NAD-dependent succinate-semialdehyde dehydrogenase [Deltaproteobacteria bacterium]|nr:NAD-dependent succinate-semialdehyde dehydrogenase [Deltaproteobacteria bacterium]